MLLVNVEKIYPKYDFFSKNYCEIQINGKKAHSLKELSRNSSLIPINKDDIVTVEIKNKIENKLLLNFEINSIYFFADDKKTTKTYYL